jgi:hypothetical protein
MPHEPGHGEPVSPYVEQVTEAREQREAIRRKTRRLPWLAVLATIAVIFGGGWAAAGLINVDNQADETSATLADIEGERRVRSIYNAEAVVRVLERQPAGRLQRLPPERTGQGREPR